MELIHQKLVSKIFRPKIIFGREKNLLRKKIGINKIWAEKKGSEKYLGPTKKLGGKKMWRQKKFAPKILGWKKILGKIFVG